MSRFRVVIGLLAITGLCVGIALAAAVFGIGAW